MEGWPLRLQDSLGSAKDEALGLRRRLYGHTVSPRSLHDDSHLPPALPPEARRTGLDAPRLDLVLTVPTTR
jgi:hypothetical protein